MTQHTNIRIEKRTRDKLDILDTALEADNMDDVVSELLAECEEERDLDLDEILDKLRKESG